MRREIYHSILRFVIYIVLQFISHKNIKITENISVTWIKNKNSFGFFQFPVMQELSRIVFWFVQINFCERVDRLTLESTSNFEFNRVLAICRKIR